VNNPLGDEGLIALSTGLKMLTKLNIGNSTDDPANYKADPKGLTAVIINLSLLKDLNISNNV
jgi:hypothetical protein